MKKINILLISLLLIFVGCNRDEQVFVPENSDNAIQVTESKTAYSRALDDAFDMMQELYPEKYNTLVSRKDLLKPEYYTTETFATAHPVAAGRMLAKSANGEQMPIDTLLYIVNFGNDEGFAVMYAGENVENNILAITESGSLTIEDLTRDYSNAPEGICDVLPGATMAGLINNGIGNLFPVDSTCIIPPSPSYYIGPWTNVGTLVDPMITVKFHQGDPYNRYTPTFNGVHTPVGCVATALLHIVSVNKYPSTINGYSGNWNYILSNPTNEDSKEILARWSREIGRICNMDYQPGGSSAFNSYARQFLNQYDRYNNVVLESFDLSHVEAMINNGHPVYCAGRDSILNKGHAWVLDGLYMQKRIIRIIAPDGTVLSTKHVYRNLVHCNFGWGGTCDGYYATDCFNLRKGAPVLGPNETKGTTDRDYSYQNVIITYTFE